MKFGKEDGGIARSTSPRKEARFLTLMSTDGGDGIGHDQVFFGDPKLVRADPGQALTKDAAHPARRVAVRPRSHPATSQYASKVRQALRAPLVRPHPW